MMISVSGGSDETQFDLVLAVDGSGKLTEFDIVLLQELLQELIER